MDKALIRGNTRQLLLRLVCYPVADWSHGLGVPVLLDDDVLWLARRKYDADPAEWTTTSAVRELPAVVPERREETIPVCVSVLAYEAALNIDVTPYLTFLETQNL